MVVKWKYSILDKNSTSSSTYDGFFVKISNGVAFCYEEQEEYEFIRQLSFDNEGRLLSKIDHHVFEDDLDVAHIQESLISIKDISDCFSFSANGKEYIYPASSLLCICPNDGATVSISSFPDWKRIYEQNIVNAHHYEEDSFEFDDYLISHKGSFGYQCKLKSTGTLMWEKKVRGYLYTDMTRYGEGILFGTAEAGGKLYYIRLSDGSSIFEIDTHGTGHFAIRDNCCYCHEVGKKAALLKINLTDGNVASLQLKGKSSIDCPIRIIDDTLYTLTFEHLNDGLDANPTVYAIQL